MNKFYFFVILLTSIIPLKVASDTNLIIKRNAEVISMGRNNPSLPILIDVFGIKKSINSQTNLKDNKKLLTKLILNRNSTSYIQANPGDYILDLRINGFVGVSSFIIHIGDLDKEIYLETFQSKHLKKYKRKYSAIKKNVDLVKVSSGPADIVISNYSKHRNQTVITKPSKIIPNINKSNILKEKIKTSTDPTKKLEELRVLFDSGLITEEVYHKLQEKYLNEILNN